MKHCEGLGAICLVCCVYAHLVLRCVFIFFWMCRVLVCPEVHFSVPCWSVLQHGMLGLLHVSFFLCVHVLASGDVISGMCVVPDWLLWLDLLSYLISSDRISSLMFMFCLSVVFLVLLFCVWVG